MSWQTNANESAENKAIKIIFDKKEAEHIVWKELMRFSLKLPTKMD